MKLRPTQALLLILLQIFLISLAEVTLFIQLFVILLVLTFIFTGLKGFYNFLNAELKIFWLLAFMFIMYSFFGDLPIVKFSMNGFLSFIKLAIRIILIVGYVNLFFNIFSFSEITSDFNYASRNLRKDSFPGRVSSVFFMSLVLFEPVFSSTRNRINDTRNYIDKPRFSNISDYLFNLFIRTLDFVDTELQKFKTSNNKDASELPNSKVGLVIWSMILIIVNSLIISSGDYFFKLKGIF